MTIQTKHNKIITGAGEFVKTFITLVIYAAICGVALLGLLYLGIIIGELVHEILN